jgi:hypothetical protein
MSGQLILPNGGLPRPNGSPLSSTPDQPRLPDASALRDLAQRFGNLGGDLIDVLMAVGSAFGVGTGTGFAATVQWSGPAAAVAAECALQIIHNLDTNAKACFQLSTAISQYAASVEQMVSEADAQTLMTVLSLDLMVGLIFFDAMAFPLVEAGFTAAATAFGADEAVAETVAAVSTDVVLGSFDAALGDLLPPYVTSAVTGVQISPNWAQLPLDILTGGITGGFIGGALRGIFHDDTATSQFTDTHGTDTPVTAPVLDTPPAEPHAQTQYLALDLGTPFTAENFFAEHADFAAEGSGFATVPGTVADHSVIGPFGPPDHAELAGAGGVGGSPEPVAAPPDATVPPRLPTGSDSVSSVIPDGVPPGSGGFDASFRADPVVVNVNHGAVLQGIGDGKALLATDKLAAEGLGTPVVRTQEGSAPTIVRSEAHAAQLDDAASAVSPPSYETVARDPVVDYVDLWRTVHTGQAPAGLFKDYPLGDVAQALQVQNAAHPVSPRELTVPDQRLSLEVSPGTVKDPSAAQLRNAVTDAVDARHQVAKQDAYSSGEPTVDAKPEPSAEDKLITMSEQAGRAQDLREAVIEFNPPPRKYTAEGTSGAATGSTRLGENLRATERTVAERRAVLAELDGIRGDSSSAAAEPPPRDQAKIKQLDDRLSALDAREAALVDQRKALIGEPPVRAGRDAPAGAAGTRSELLAEQGRLAAQRRQVLARRDPADPAAVRPELEELNHRETAVLRKATELKIKDLGTQLDTADKRLPQVAAEAKAKHAAFELASAQRDLYRAESLMDLAKRNLDQVQARFDANPGDRAALDAVAARYRTTADTHGQAVVRKQAAVTQHLRYLADTAELGADGAVDAAAEAGLRHAQAKSDYWSAKQSAEDSAAEFRFAAAAHTEAKEGYFVVQEEHARQLDALASATTPQAAAHAESALADARAALADGAVTVKASALVGAEKLMATMKANSALEVAKAELIHACRELGAKNAAADAAKAEAADQRDAAAQMETEAAQDTPGQTNPSAAEGAQPEGSSVTQAEPGGAARPDVPTPVLQAKAALEATRAELAGAEASLTKAVKNAEIVSFSHDVGVERYFAGRGKAKITAARTEQADAARPVDPAQSAQSAQSTAAHVELAVARTQLDVLADAAAHDSYLKVAKANNEATLAYDFWKTKAATAAKAEEAYRRVLATAARETSSDGPDLIAQALPPRPTAEELLKNLYSTAVDYNRAVSEWRALAVSSDGAFAELTGPRLADPPQWAVGGRTEPLSQTPPTPRTAEPADPGHADGHPAATAASDAAASDITASDTAPSHAAHFDTTPADTASSNPAPSDTAHSNTAPPATEPVPEPAPHGSTGPVAHESPTVHLINSLTCAEPAALPQGLAFPSATSARPDGFAWQKASEWLPSAPGVVIVPGQYSPADHVLIMDGKSYTPQQLVAWLTAQDWKLRPVVVLAASGAAKSRPWGSSFAQEVHALLPYIRTLTSGRPAKPVVVASPGRVAQVGSQVLAGTLAAGGFGAFMYFSPSTGWHAVSSVVPARGLGGDLRAALKQVNVYQFTPSRNKPTATVVWSLPGPLPPADKIALVEPAATPVPLPLGPAAKPVAVPSNPDAVPQPNVAYPSWKAVRASRGVASERRVASRLPSAPGVLVLPGVYVPSEHAYVVGGIQYSPKQLADWLVGTAGWARQRPVLVLVGGGTTQVQGWGTSYAQEVQAFLPPGRVDASGRAEEPVVVAAPSQVVQHGWQLLAGTLAADDDGAVMFFEPSTGWQAVSSAGPLRSLGADLVSALSGLGVTRITTRPSGSTVPIVWSRPRSTMPSTTARALHPAAIPTPLGPRAAAKLVAVPDAGTGPLLERPVPAPDAAVHAQAIPVRSGYYFPPGRRSADDADLTYARSFPKVPGFTFVFGHRDAVLPRLKHRDRSLTFEQFAQVVKETTDVGPRDRVVMILCGATRAGEPDAPDAPDALGGPSADLAQHIRELTGAGVLTSGGFVWQLETGVRVDAFELDLDWRPVLRVPDSAAPQRTDLPASVQWTWYPPGQTQSTPMGFDLAQVLRQISGTDRAPDLGSPGLKSPVAWVRT